jgi:DNA-binding NtrC family response regulator
LTKPLDLKELELVVSRVLQHRRVADNLDYIRRRERSESALDQIIGRSEPMAMVRRMVERFLSTPALGSQFPPTVLLTGETGTGKDLVARAIHYAGPRRDGPFVPVNCTALPEHLVEAELFGHVKGAFTDARGDKRGLFEVADGGTLFLDEIGHMKPSLQAKLLGALEHRTIRPVGGTSERKINTHLIAATNRDLQAAIKTGEFRDDLYHRLRVLTVHLPPLRERGADVEELARHFLQLYTTRFGMPAAEISAEALAILRRYDWPGNVRELSHAIESALLIADGPRIGPEHLNVRPAGPGGAVEVHLPGARVIAVDFADPERCPKLDALEHEVIRAALQYTHNNLSQAARLLGISRDAIRYRMEKREKEET